MVRRQPSEATLLDVARHAGVSKSSVSRVLNDHPYVSPENRRAVLTAIEALGYQRNHAGLTLRTRTSNTIGLLAGNLRNPVWAAIADGMERILAQRGRTLVVGNGHNDSKTELDVALTLMARGVDGLVASTSDERSEMFDWIDRRKLPTVVIDRDVRGPYIDQVLTDHLPGVKAAVDDLRGHGHRRIGLVSPPRETRAGRSVAEAFAATAPPQDEGLTISGALSEEFGQSAVSQLLDLPNPPTALLLGGTQLLVGALMELNKRQLRIPKDISLVSYDRCDLARVHVPPISTIERDLEEMGERAVYLLLDRVDGIRSVARKIVLPNQYVPLGSVAPPSSQLAGKV